MRNFLTTCTTLALTEAAITTEFFLISLLHVLENTGCIFLFFLSDCLPFSFFLERGKTLVQRKPTMYPAWKATFDAHIYEGRVIEILLMKTAEEPLAEVTVGVSVLAERCKKANGRAEFWVGH